MRDKVLGSGVGVMAASELSGAKSEMMASPVPLARGHRLTRYADGARPCEGKALSGTMALRLAPETVTSVMGVLTPSTRSWTALAPDGLITKTESKVYAGSDSGKPWRSRAPINAPDIDGIRGGADRAIERASKAEVGAVKEDLRA